MATTRTTVTLGDDLARQARRLGINVSAAARQGILDAVRDALAHADRVAYEQRPERPDASWSDIEAWGEE